MHLSGSTPPSSVLTGRATSLATVSSAMVCPSPRGSNMKSPPFRLSSLPLPRWIRQRPESRR
ncbi:hypothetical protein DP49_5721 [Burkholderia pseudomallei]|nr:hypothetical protein DP49_5721 [Burkholderia pseudomallei]